MQGHEQAFLKKNLIEFGGNTRQSSRSFPLIGFALCIGLLVANDSLLRAQDSTDHEAGTRYWISFGLGGNSQGFAEGAGASLLLSHTIVSIHANTSVNFSTFITQTPFEHTEAYGLLVGRAWSLGRTIVSISSGLSYVVAVQQGDFLYTENFFFPIKHFEEARENLIGIPIEVEAMIRSPFPVFGVSLSAFANVNSGHSFAGVLVSFQIGKLR